MPSLAASAAGFCSSRLNLLTNKAYGRSGQSFWQHAVVISNLIAKRYSPILALLSLLALCPHAYASVPSGKNPAPTADASASAALKPAAAPDFALLSTQGETVKLSHFRGKIVLMNFWASWCPPCRAEMPVLDNLAKTHKAAGLVVLGLNVDVDNESRDEYLKEHPVSFPILDDSKWSTAKLYIAPSQPVTFFIDREGNLAHVHQGYKTGDDLVYATKVKELLAK